MVDALHLVRAFKERGRAFENTLYSLRVADEDGNTVRTALVLPRSVTYHPIKRFPIAVTFYNYNANIGARVDVPIVYDLSSAKMPGFLNTMHEQVRCFVKGNAIPSQIYINMADYVDARAVRWSDVSTAPFDLKLCPDTYAWARDKGDITLATIKVKKSGRGEDDDEEEEVWEF